MDGEIDYGELFGVDAPGFGAEPAGEQEAQPAGEPEAEPDKPDGAELAPDSGGPEPGVPEQNLGPEQEPGSASGPDVPPREPERDPDETAARAREEAKRAVDEAFALSGLRNPYTGQPITSKAEYDAYRERFEAERREQLLKKSGMSQEEFQQLVQGLPEVREAREAQAAAEKTAREAREAAARVKIGEQLKEIGAMDPSIKSLEDLAKMPSYPRFYELVRKGNTLTDAFKLANYDRLTQGAAAGARQAAVNAVRAKEHLEQTRSRGKGAVSVPAEVKELYGVFNPDATDEEIQRHYQKNHKE